MFVLMLNSDEHLRRSPDCVFFALSTTAKPRAGRSRKGRASKASRMSTQSNFTTVSDGISVADTDVNRDDSIMSVVEPAKASKSAKGAKKGVKAKKPAAKSKRQASKVLDEDTQVTSSILEPEDDDFEVKVETVPSEIKGNKKRKSEEMSARNDESNHAELHNQEEDSQDQSRKRRATGSRGSMAQTRNAPSPPPQEEHEIDAQMTDAETMPPPVPSLGQMKGKGGKKRGSSNMRKASTASTASKASLRAAIPPDEDIDAALEAELDRPLTDEEGDIEPPAMAVPKGRRLTRTKPGSRNATASVAPTRRTTRASTVTVDNSMMQDIYPFLPHPAEETHVPTPEKNEFDASVHDSLGPSSRPKQSKKKSTRKASEQQKAQEKKVEKSEAMAAAEDTKDETMPKTEPQQPRSRLGPRQMPARNTRTSNISSSFEPMDLASDIPSSRLDVQTAQDDSGHETDASVVKQARTKRGGKKAPGKKVKAGKKDALMSRNIEDLVQPIVDVALPGEQGTHTRHVDDHAGGMDTVSVEAEEPEKEEKSLRGSAKPGKAEKPEPKTFAREGSAAPSTEQPTILAEAKTVHPSPQPLSSLSTPMPNPSPQSSDAENQPPSSRPPKQCPTLSMQSTSKSQISRVPLAATTPVNSPSKNNISKLQTTFPWTAIEIEHIFEGTPSADKENSPFAFGAAGKNMKRLPASPEKKLTVEQWIQSNAQRGEEILRNECERLVGKFEGQGVRALRVLEGIVCAESL